MTKIKNKEDELEVYNETFEINAKVKKMIKDKEKQIHPKDVFVGLTTKPIKGRAYKHSVIDKKKD